MQLATKSSGKASAADAQAPGEGFNMVQDAGKVSAAEQTLLRYLCDHSSGPGDRISMDPKLIVRALWTSPRRLVADAASVAAKGCAGVRRLRPNARDVPSTTCSAIRLTGAGEAYLAGLGR
jgi:hypothetical protein